MCRIFKEVHFDASHRLLHYKGKCACLHGHRWKVEVWMEGHVDEKTGILVDYQTIKTTIERFDHQILLNRDDPMVAAIQTFHPVITTPGEPTSELLASLIAGSLNDECSLLGLRAKVTRIRVHESPSCYAEIVYEGQ